MLAPPPVGPYETIDPRGVLLEEIRYISNKLILA